MKKIIFYCSFILLLVSCSSLENNDADWEIDTYVDMTLSQVIEFLGKPKYISEKVIDNNYSPTPVEPPYFIFFTEEELKNSIEITIAMWIKGNREILVYLKNVDDELTVFTSINHRIKRSW